MLDSFFDQLLLHRMQRARAVVAVRLRISYYIVYNYIISLRIARINLLLFDLVVSHQDWILNRVTLLNLARHPRWTHFLWEKKKSNCQRSNYQWEWERPLHQKTTCVLFHSKISFISLKPWQRVMTWLIKNCPQALSPSSVKKKEVTWWRKSCQAVCFQSLSTRTWPDMLARAAEDQHSTGRCTVVPLSTKSVLQELDVKFVESRWKNHNFSVYFLKCSVLELEEQKWWRNDLNFPELFPEQLPS